jgi:hypothetical protein
MKKYINLTCALIVFLSTTSFQNGDILCDSKTLKEKAKSALGPYKYDSSELTRIIYKKTETVKEIEIPLFIGEKYRFIFNLEALPKNIEIQIYNKDKDSKNRKLLFSSKDGGIDRKELQWEVSKVRQVYINYIIPPTEDGSYSGCALFIICYK